MPGRPPLDIDVIDKDRMQALLTDGRWVPITNLFGAEPDTHGQRKEVDTWDEAATFVCGEGETWFGASVDDFASPTVN